MSEQTHEIHLNFTAKKLDDGRLDISCAELDDFSVVVDGGGVTVLDKASKPIQAFIQEAIKRKIAEIVTFPTKANFNIKTSLTFDE